jgi:hypothetical protein
MTNGLWDDYINNRVIGYEDLKTDKTAPKNETIRRDRIIELYGASTPEQRYTTPVYVWYDGQEQETSLAAAHKFLLNPAVHINTAGRQLAAQAGDTADDSEVQ